MQLIDYFFKEDAEEEGRAWHIGADVQRLSRSPKAEGDGCLQAAIHPGFLLKGIVPHHWASYTPHATYSCPCALTNRTLSE